MSDIGTSPAGTTNHRQQVVLASGDERTTAIYIIRS
jgi:hypothetical protein